VKRLFQLLAGWPLPVLHAVGAALGWLSFLLSPTYRDRFRANARQAGYPMAAVRPAVGEAGKLVGEVPRLWFGAMPDVEWEGAEIVDAARAKNRGIVFLTPHLGCFEITAQAYAMRFGAVTVLYRPARKAWLQELIATARSRPNLTAVPANLSGVRAMLKTLRTGGTIGLLPDQVPPQGLGVWAPFFGQPAYTMTLPARLVQQTGAELLLIWGERLPAGRGYRVRVRAWGAGPLASEAEAAAAQVNAEMERLVRECPTQYLWGYARYKPPRQGGAA
jgi:KDO2-lipid IV(A) lauroyltransferase